MTAQKVLRIDASISGSAGQSNRLADELIASLQEQHTLDINHRDLNAEPLPHLNGDILAAIGLPPEERDAAQQEWASAADQVVDELKQADIMILGMPMYNFGVPSTVKAWMDYAARAGQTFRYTENGPEGLLTGKTAYIVSTRGGLHRNKPSDSQTSAVDVFLNFLGIKAIHWIYAEGIAMSDYKSSAITGAKQHIKALIHQGLSHETA